MIYVECFSDKVLVEKLLPQYRSDISHKRVQGRWPILNILATRAIPIALV